MAKKSALDRKDTPEFKADVIRLVADIDSILAIAKEMGIRNSNINAWRAAEKINIYFRRRGWFALSTTPLN